MGWQGALTTPQKAVQMRFSKQDDVRIILSVNVSSQPVVRGVLNGRTKSVIVLWCGVHGGEGAWQRGGMRTLHVGRFP